MVSDHRSGVLRARMRRTPDGMFLAEYSSELDQTSDAIAPSMPDSHLGANREEVRFFVEQMARNLGYDRVAWEEETA